jgi:hypothetical protein
MLLSIDMIERSVILTFYLKSRVQKEKKIDIKIEYKNVKNKNFFAVKIYLVTLIILTNSGFKEAPPTRKPLISG